MIVTFADPDLNGADVWVAVTVISGGSGTLVGAVYMPDLEILPQSDFAQASPAMLHVTSKVGLPFGPAENPFMYPAGIVSGPVGEIVKGAFGSDGGCLTFGASFAMSSGPKS